VKHVAEAVLSKAKVVYNSNVINIIQLEPSSPQHSGVSVETKSGSSLFFDEIVVTCPLGWLKLNQNAFVPEIPTRLREAIDSISYGTLEKCWVTFPSAFWKQDSDQEELPLTLFLSPEYSPDSNPGHWNQEFLALSSLPESLDHPTLLLYIFGPCSKHITDGIDKLQEGSPEYNEYLDRFLKPYYSRLPGYAPEKAECKPVGFLATNWQNDEFSGYGSYSNFQVGLKNGGDDIKVMRQGMGMERGIWLAGEHTAPFVASGTVTGAYWSGENVATRILQAYSLVKDEEIIGQVDENGIAVVTGTEAIKANPDLTFLSSENQGS
jgi:hypothetical protein